MADRYKSFAELLRHHQEDKDFRVEEHSGILPVLIMAPHGGKIEYFTSELARMIAGSDLGYYSFIGQMRNNNIWLHITSHRFDEPRALRALAGADIVLAIHGMKGDSPSIMVGGLHFDLSKALSATLTQAGFFVEQPKKGLAGCDPRNVCNRGCWRRGSQLELSLALRRELESNGERCQVFVNAVRSAILNIGVVPVQWTV